MTTDLKTTPMHAWHMGRNANMAGFGGYDLPLWYPTNAITEHLAVINRAGMFDTSHMAVMRVEGPGAFELLQWCFTKDLTACVGPDRRVLSAGRCVYGAFLSEKGHAIDDAIVYRFDGERFMVVVNAGMGGTVSGHLRSQAGDRKVGITDLTDRLGKIDVQGPAAGRVLSRVLAGGAAALDGLPYFSFKGHFDPSTPEAGQAVVDGGPPVLLSRTGYTGEFGFELFVERAHTLGLWERLLEAGAEYGLIPCGLASRDSLRTGAVLPLSHQDIGPWPFVRHPWTFALPLEEKGSGFTKDFLGVSALLAASDAEYTYPFAGFDVRKVDAHDAVVLDAPDGREIGKVLTCTTDVAVGRHEGRIYSVASPDRPEGFNPRGLSCGFVKVGVALAAGQKVILQDRRRKIEVMVEDDIRPNRTARRPMKSMLIS